MEERRYIITYETLHRIRGVIVVKANNDYFANIYANNMLKETGIIEIIKIREIFNPYINAFGVITDYEKSLLKNGIHSATKKYNLTLTRYNTIAQIYGDKLLKDYEYGG